jgi:DNA-binding response OmpR family regulator
MAMIQLAGGARLDLSQHRVIVDGRTRWLARAEALLLRRLAEAPGEVVSARELFESVTGRVALSDVEAREWARWAAYRCRRKVGAAAAIVNRPRLGYRLATV